MNRTIVTILAIVFALTVRAFGQNEYVLHKDISYVLDGKSEDAYRNERCVLDVYAPTGAKGLPVVVFYHGGGLEGGEKFIPEPLKRKGLVVVSPNYRLYPKAKCATYVEDAAEALAWTVRNVEKYGGDASKIIVCGHSAGGYLTLMLALDKKYLARHGVDADSMAGYVPQSGQTNTHYTIRKERGIDMDIPIIDSMAPINHARKLVPPMVLVTGERGKEMLARYTENLHLQDIMRAKGVDVPLYELGGFDHGTMLNPSFEFVLQMVGRISK